MNMANFRRIAGNTLMIGGLLTTARSGMDSVRNTAFHREIQEKANIQAELNKKYGVGMECMPGGASSICYRVIYGRHTEEEREAILAQHGEELHTRLDAIPTDPAAHARAQRDGLGLLAGLGIAAAGVELRRGRQFRQEMESRRGRRKEF